MSFDSSDDGFAMPSPEVRLEFAINRVMRIWSLIKQVPESSLSDLRSALVASLCQLHGLSENELVVAGLKFLYGTT